ncbi:alanine racemase [Succinivibrio dextrinosolvens]|uniref:alanine racemase n=1 Tax=Succinivibrio dextrinosolvens TaxID=83771 RepID=UPI0008E5AF8D|nr:alanine racemase [Succinivibrio dextrinosolvens]SFS40333.1 alanine racemase [Succinivibrio dextrinosolvens]
MESVTALIDKQALIHNIKVIKDKAKDSKVIAVIKANAYGHGAIAVANALKDKVEGFAVARIGEAMDLRRDGIKNPIFLLEGFYNDDDLPFISKYDLYTAVNTMEQVEAIERVSFSKPIHVWIQVDIGMHRLGSNDKATIAKIKSRLEKCDKVIKPLGLLSHLSVADTPAEFEYNKTQISNFFDFAKDIQGDLCLTNSAGIFDWQNSHTQWIRPGIVMYGISPFEDRTGEDLGLKPVMTLKSNLIAINKVKKGDKIGYGAYYVADKDTTIGIVSCGYGDGYPRTAPNGTPVLINGRYVKTAGHVCMDMLFVDLGENCTDKVGDEVILWGKGLPVEKISALCNTIPYELICHVMPRVEFVFG